MTTDKFFIKKPQEESTFIGPFADPKQVDSYTIRKYERLMSIYVQTRSGMLLWGDRNEAS